MIVFGIQCNFFIVLPNRLKTCRLIGVFFFCAPERALSASGAQFVQTCRKPIKENSQSKQQNCLSLKIQNKLAYYCMQQAKHEFNVKQKNVKGRTFVHWTEKNNDLLKTLLLKN